MSRRRKYIDVMKHPIALVIPRDEFISNKEIARRSRQSTRHAREAIALLAKDHCVISISQKGGGIKLPKRFEECKNDDEVRAEIDLVRHGLNEKRARITELKKRMRPDIAYIKAGEKWLQKKGGK